MMSSIANLCLLVPYFPVDAADVQVHTNYLPNTTQLMAVHISWPRLSSVGGVGGVSNLGMVVALTGSSLVNTSCTAPGRDPPCFIAKHAVSIIYYSGNN